MSGDEPSLNVIKKLKTFQKPFFTVAKSENLTSVFRFHFTFLPLQKYSPLGENLRPLERTTRTCLATIWLRAETRGLSEQQAGSEGAGRTLNAALASAKPVFRNRRTGKGTHYECDLDKMEQLNSETKFLRTIRSTPALRRHVGRPVRRQSPTEARFPTMSGFPTMSALCAA